VIFAVATPVAASTEMIEQQGLGPWAPASAAAKSRIEMTGANEARSFFIMTIALD
jgi:hypothetical protein